MQQHTYQTLPDVSKRVNWRIDDIIGGDKRLDFSKLFFPETFARSKALSFLSDQERLTLNHIRAHNYLAMFALVEGFILPFVYTAIAHDDGAPHRAKALQHSRAKKRSLWIYSGAS